MKYFLPLIGCMLLTLPALTQRDCRSFDYRQQQLKANPGLAVAVQAAEQFTRQQMQRPVVGVTGESPSGRSASALITIPVVVHVIYNTSSQNISDDQIASQLVELNRDYQKLNPDTSGIPSYYAPLAANCGFHFALAQVDTNGNPSSGIVRVHTNVSSFSLDDAVKYSARGGDDPWDRDRYLNVWICNLGDGVLGYSSLVGGPKETDGVVVLYTAFGTTGTATAPFNKGRTATHEIGHWLNLIHVWGDADCGDDQVADTPPQSAATYGNPSGIVISCGNTPYGNMYMNYMDFTDDAGMHMFTVDQNQRMHTLFSEGGFRYPLLSSPALTGITGSNGVPVDEASGIAVSVGPNPTFGMVTVKVASDPGGVLTVWNQMGQMVYQVRVTQTTFRLDLSRFGSGVYFLRLVDGDKRGIAKVVKL